MPSLTKSVLVGVALLADILSFVVNVGARANGRVEKARRNKEERREEFVTGYRGREGVTAAHEADR